MLIVDPSRGYNISHGECSISYIVLCIVLLHIVMYDVIVMM